MNQQEREDYTNVSERREPVWQPQAAQQPEQQRWAVDPSDAHTSVGKEKPSKTSWKHILELLAISIALGAFARQLSAFDDTMATHSMLLIGVGLLCGIGASCYGIAVWWRMFQRSWWQALCWMALMLCLNGLFYVALHPQG